MKLFFKIFAVFLIVSVSYFLTGCAYNNIKEKAVSIHKHIFFPEKTVIKKVIKNYSGFKNISGRARMIYDYNGISYEESGFYKYSKGKYLKFVIMDMYGNIAFSANVDNAGAIFTNTRRTKKNPNSTIKVLFDKKYKTKSIDSYKRIFKSVRILLNLEDTDKINKSDIFYNTKDGYFFEYKQANNTEEMIKNKIFNRNNLSASDGINKINKNKIKSNISKIKKKYYYMYVNSKFLVYKIAYIKNKKFIEIIKFSKFIKKSGIYLPLKISIDDYVYNVKIIIKLSKGSKLTLNKAFKN
ncbi:MAG: hypothetical protein EVG15_07915 [Candidatus Acididesulfobacter diazotrophicus]|uniref:Lipoprotein n=1 Tax=Candidatus Acididesulfobacter diazotrophicus TaxID=2597226 RepID=A0A519BLC3_9DELT|nr:MAG: hypothetical protein EVG15_07915 [Candidatus Acididesulfobacter diazotrophicus]